MFEVCLYKGHSNSRKINELVLSLRLVDTETGLILHLINVAGTRMKQSGIYVFSRGDILEDCKNPLEFIQLNESDD